MLESTYLLSIVICNRAFVFFLPFLVFFTVTFDHF
jgi:hypothetical protein